MEGENSLWRPREKETVRDRRGQRERERQLEKEEDGRDHCFVDSTARLLDAGRWVGSECSNRHATLASVPDPFLGALRAPAKRDRTACLDTALLGFGNQPLQRWPTPPGQPNTTSDRRVETLTDRSTVTHESI